MPKYNKPSVDLVVDLINESNPQLPFPIETGKVLFTGLATRTPGSGEYQDTQIKVNAKNNTEYVGNKLLQYRRIDIGKLFRGTSIEIHKYSPTSISQNPYTLHQLLDDINAKYGLALTTAEVTNIAFPAASDNYYPTIRTSKVNMVIQSTSLAWKGTVEVRWVQAPQELQTMITQPELTGRLYPGGNDFSGAHPYVLDLEAYAIDFTETNAAGLNATGTFGSGIAAQITAQQTLVTLLAQVTGKAYAMDSANAGQPYNLYGCSYQKFALPNVVVPEANSRFYNSVVVLTYSNASNWGVGRLFMHHNV